MQSGRAARFARGDLACNGLFSTFIDGYSRATCPSAGIEATQMKQVADGEIVHFDNVGLRYGTDREVLSDVSFTLFPGSFYFLTGASGAGKTSLLKLLYLAQRPSRGRSSNVSRPSKWSMMS